MGKKLGVNDFDVLIEITRNREKDREKSKSQRKKVQRDVL